MANMSAFQANDASSILAARTKEIDRAYVRSISFDVKRGDPNLASANRVSQMRVREPKRSKRGEIESEATAVSPPAPK